MYHMVREHIPKNKYNSLRVDPSMFEKQIKYLYENGWTSYTISEAVEQREHLPEKSVVITFDDGYKDNMTNAFPILKKYNFKATIYLINNRENIGLTYEPKLSDNDVMTLIESRLIEIGAHTLSHVNLLNCDEAVSHKEICDSKHRIEKDFDIECKSFAYPFGKYKESDVVVVKGCGYTNTVTTKKGIADLTKCNLFEISRVTISGKDSFWVFLLKLKTGKRGVFK